MEEKYFVCQDSMEGIFSGIYEAFSRREEKEYIHLQVGEEDNLRLFASYHEIIPDGEKTQKVAAAISRDFGQEVYMDICQALSSPEIDKAEAVLRTLIRGYRMRDRKRILTDLADPHVHRVFALSRNAGCEIHHLKGFVRFQELDNGILYSKIGPKNNIVTFLAPHFSNRLPLQDFVICDEKRGIFVIHPRSKQWYVVQDMEIDGDLSDRFSEEEESYQRLFRWFCQKIAIEGRKNIKLQNNMLPIRFQEYMVEFDKKI